MAAIKTIFRTPKENERAVRDIEPQEADDIEEVLRQLDAEDVRAIRREVESEGDDRFKP